MALDAEGIPQSTGTFETLEADSVILALGQQAESGFLAGIPGIVDAAIQRFGGMTGRTWPDQG
jgi:hypothetical protein